MVGECLVESAYIIDIIEECQHHALGAVGLPAYRNQLVDILPMTGFIDCLGVTRRHNAHNGILPSLSTRKNKDTWVFCRPANEPHARDTSYYDTTTASWRYSKMIIHSPAATCRSVSGTSGAGSFGVAAPLLPAAAQCRVCTGR
jgi:hypothetical protein